MNFVSNRSDILIDEFNNLEEVKRIHELEGFIDKNNDIKLLFKELKLKQKQLVNAKEYNQINQYNIYLNEYNDIYKKLIDYPFVEEYLELLDVVDKMLVNVCQNIENGLTKAIND